MKKQHVPPQPMIDAVLREAVVAALQTVHRETGKPVRSKCAVWVYGQSVPQNPVDIEPASAEIVGECRVSFRPTFVSGRSLFRAQVRLPAVAPEFGYAGFDLSGDAKLVDGRVVLSRVAHTNLYGPHPFRDEWG